MQALSTDGRKPRRIYDAAKTPLQRLLLSQVLPASSEQELQRAACMLDPLRLLYHLQDLQQALLCPQVPPASEAFETASGAILSFCLERCVGRPSAVSLAQPEPAAVHQIPSSCREVGAACAVLSALPAEEDHADSSQGMTESGAECQSQSTHEGWRHLHTYLDDYRLRVPVGEEQMDANSDHLFLSEAGQPLTKNCIAHVFDRLRNRAGITGKQVTASLLRKCFAVRYLQAGGDPDTLQELLGQLGSLSWHHAQRKWD